MKKIQALFRREWLQSFNTPVGYTFIVLFLLIENYIFFYGFGSNSFWDRKSSDMGVFFQSVPYLLLLFVPAIGMRIWTEEKESGTWEILFTLPLTEWQIVLGKFFSTFFYVIVTLCCTVFIPLTLSVLGDPDWGLVFSGYLGLFLLSSSFVSLVLYFTLFLRSQVISFLVGVLTLISFYLLGSQRLIDFFSSGFIKIFSIPSHYEPFRLGILDPRDFYFFISLDFLFLYLSVIRLRYKR